MKKNKTRKGRESLYSLDTYKMKYERTKKQRNEINASFKKRLQHAWEVLKG